MDSSNSYMLSPQATRSQTSSPVVGGMTEGKTQNGTSLWNASVRAQTGSDEFEHYAFHSTAGSSSAAPTNGHGGLTQQCLSSQSSPRSWSSPDHHFRPVSASGSGSGSSWGSYPAEQSYPGAAGRQNTPQVPSKTLSRENLFQSNDYHNASTATSYPSTGSFFPSHHYPTHNSISSLSQESNYPPSPCSSIPNNFKLDCDSDMLSTAPASEAGDDFLVSSQYPSCNLLSDSSMSSMSSSVSSPVSPSTGLDSTPTTTLPGNSKAELPYAQLIYKAFMSTPNKAMTLQDIYQWFRENTEKGKSDTKGWQNSIRHNLSMNHAFTKRERKPEGSTNTNDEDNAASTDSNNSDSKKSTEWYLEPWAVKGGVQSTTRYRKGNHASRRAAAASACNASRRHMKDGKYDLYSTGMSTRSSSSLANRNKISKSGNRATLRGNGTAPAGLQMHYYGHHIPHQHHYGVSMVTSAPEQHYNPYMSPVSARPAVTHGLPEMMSATSAPSCAADFYESYTDPAILASSLEQQQQQQQAQAQREASEPMSVMNEPITPEASFGSPPLMATNPTSSSASYYPSPEDHTMNFASAHHHAGYHQPQVYQDEPRYGHHNGWEHAQSVAVPATGMMYGHYA
ncbi:hypothetical protein B0H65DRAFT_414021 [Neurospora tetraspora]|uniref:Fork-head domain-containing protein n=1 Tax=Neurospora tetraspora TaxID=94610 RepID=A0AAE0MXT3_9PEZI|nr:hypothetical protein B0H65DRAFT_414021 [Neurospora tetraspora]